MNETPQKQTKKNYCGADGSCKVQHYPDERNCLFYTKPESPFCHFCVLFIGGDCLSPDARTAARQD